MTTCIQTSKPETLHVMWKTVSEDCKLTCDYCYYSTAGGHPQQPIRVMDTELQERFIAQYMKRSSGIATFSWQGGEPLLAGLPYFERVISLQAKYAPPHTMISNALQTNGTLIHEKWAKFFKRYNFLVGISVDGPESIHDAHRITGSGKGSYDLVMRGICHLQNEGVDYSILTVIHEDNVMKPDELMAFYQVQQFPYIQFIPCMDFVSQKSDMPGRFRITPEQYGVFLCRTFDLWYNEGDPELPIRIFENMLLVFLHREAELCVHNSCCPKMMVLETNGDAYPCDFFIDEEHRLGNISQTDLEVLLASPVYDDFLLMKPDMKESCHKCEYLSFCNGGCPRNRNWLDVKDRNEVDYFCHSYKMFYSHTYERMMMLANRLRSEQLMEFRKNAKSLPGRNEPCLCGSGKKFKNCCQPL
ncbi:anaerobic sulfatase maturase [Paenibacillus odorifer]|uniref:Anaerobic sulfatase maturase n=1 Tax=Paenibacillus odorifer TaxID=189426 RepID=A0A1R0Y3D9_9BACL|nr:anaerobic sulfatase maturase [Paenibacillus odorifer]OMD41827.1 anaerobic sulfatase maturase [Paenibacillus odorifer]